MENETSHGFGKRGDKRWNHFYLAYGILSVVVTQIISISEFGKGYKGDNHGYGFGDPAVLGIL